MARPVAAARRYAEAVFGLALRDGTEDAWLTALRAARDLVGDETLTETLENPAIAEDARLDLMGSILSPERLGADGRPADARVARQLLALVELLLERGRIELLPAVAERYATLLNQHRGIVTAIVTSAAPLSDADVAEIRSRVEAMAGAGVDLRTQVDEGLIGGLTIQVGDRLLDASVRGRLERLREQLLTGARTR